MGQKKCAPPVKNIVIQQKIIHPEYIKLENDIGLLMLRESVNLEGNSYVSTICLPTKDLQLKQVEETFLIAGWGRTEKSATSNALLKATVSRKSIDTCRNVFGQQKIVDDIIICAGGENLVDSCRGDSGGPLFWKSKIHSSSRYIQHGITGTGSYRCGESFKGVTPPTMYTNVANYIDWIQKSMK